MFTAIKNSGGLFGSLGRSANNFMDSFTKNLGANLADKLTNTSKNAGNYSLNTKNFEFGKSQTQAPMGEYTFAKESSSYVPDTEFANNVVNKAQNSGLYDKLKTNFQTNLQEGNMPDLGGNYSVPNISGGGFQYSTPQIAQAQMIQPQNNRSNIANLYDYLIR